MLEFWIFETTIKSHKNKHIAFSFDVIRHDVLKIIRRSILCYAYVVIVHQANIFISNVFINYRTPPFTLEFDTKLYGNY